MSEEKKKEIVIVAPHPDDEIIGCWEILKNEKPIIIYSGNTPLERREESTKLKDHVKIKAQLFQMSIPTSFTNDQCTIYCPDPAYEINPEHRMWGMIGESMLRSGINIIFYNTNMNAPYIHELKDSKEKEELLNKVYPSQKSLWEYEKKYVLYEGRNKWIM